MSGYPFIAIAIVVLGAGVLHEHPPRQQTLREQALRQQTLREQALRQQAPRVTIRVQPAKISAGDTALLSWSATGVDSIYISHIGIVAASGTMKVSPRSTTNYLALAESEKGVAVKSVKLAVSGARGGSEFPDLSEGFCCPQSARSTARLTALLYRIESILQNEYSLAVKSYQLNLNGPQHEFLTTRGIRSDLLDANDRTIGARRVAFHVVVYSHPTTGHELTFVVKTLVEYRKRLLRTWRVEDNPTISINEARKLIARINAAR